MGRVLVVLVCLPALGLAQNSNGYRETPEPPLAESAEGNKLAESIKLVAGREPAKPAAVSRLADATAPLVQLTVKAPTAVATGREVELRLIVENVGRTAAKNVVVFNPLPPGSNVVDAVPKAEIGPVWKFDVLPAGARREIVLKYSTPPGKTEIENVARVTFDYETKTNIKVAKPDLKVRKSGPEQASRFDILVFTIDVTNSGPVELTDIKVVDLLPPGLTHAGDPERTANSVVDLTPTSQTTPDKQTRTWTIAKIGPGQTRRIDYYVVANQVGALAHGTSVSAAGVAQVDAKSQVTVAEPKLELKAEAPAREQANRPARLTVRLTNRGSRTLTNVVVTDRLRNDCILEGISAGGQQFESLVQWIVPSLAPNETRTMELAVRQPKGGQVAHDVTAVYRGATQQATAGTEFEATPILAWEVRGSAPTVSAGREVTYTVTVDNTGSALATNVRPVVSLPPELTMTNSKPFGTLDAQGKITFDAVKIEPGARATFLVMAKASRQGEARVAVELAADVFTTGPVRKQEMTVIGPAQPIAPPATPAGPLVRPAAPPPRP